MGATERINRKRITAYLSDSSALSATRHYETAKRNPDPEAREAATQKLKGVGLSCAEAGLDPGFSPAGEPQDDDVEN